MTDVIDAKYIERSIDKALLADPPLPPTPANNDRTFYGFAVSGDLFVAETLQATNATRRILIDRYRDHALALHRFLTHLGIEPIAVITTRAWEEILRRSGLLVVSPDQNGSIWISTNLARKMDTALDGGPGTFWLAVLVSTLLNIYPSIIYDFIWPCFVGWATGIALSYLMIWQIGRMRRRTRIRRYMATHSWQQFLHELAVDGLHLYRSESGCQMQLQLPQAPRRTVELLRKLSGDKYCRAKIEILSNNGINVQVAAVPEAIWLEGGMQEYFKAGLAVIKAERRAALTGDPIVFYRYGTAVAILDQFGHWPIEKQVVDEVCASEHLL